MCLCLTLLISIEFGDGIDGAVGRVERFQEVGLVPVERGKDMIIGCRAIEVYIHIFFHVHHLSEVHLIVHRICCSRDIDDGVHVAIAAIGEHGQLSHDV